MEMQSQQHRSKRGAVEVQEQDGEDRLSRLPDDILHSILRALPLKHAARTSALSRRWARTWLRALASSRVLDFTDRDFARGQASARAAVSCCLRLHAEHGAPLDAFRVALGSAGAFERDVVGWIASAVARGATKVEVDLTPPPAKGDAGDESSAFVELSGDLFVASNSLASLALGGFSLRAVPAGSAGLAGLRSLSLSHADVTDEAVRDIVSGCRALEILSLKSCDLLRSIMIAGAMLRALEIVRCPAVRELRVNAPALESFAFHGEIVYSTDDDDDLSSGVDLGSTPALRDAYLSHIGFFDDDEDQEYAYSSFLRCVAHARALTLCSVGLLHLWDQLGYDPFVEIDMTNVQELQLLLSTVGEDDGLESFSCFFQTYRLPFLDRLFVNDILLAETSQLPSHTKDASDAAAAALPGEVVDDSKMMIYGCDFVLDHLSFIKLVNFRGTRFELQLLAFLLKRAPALEQLVLVTVGEEGGAQGPGDEHVIQGWVSGMRKASPVAQLTVCWSSEDRSQNPVHTRFYHERQEYSGTPFDLSTSRLC